MRAANSDSACSVVCRAGQHVPPHRERHGKWQHTTGRSTTLRRNPLPRSHGVVANEERDVDDSGGRRHAPGGAMPPLASARRVSSLSVRLLSSSSFLSIRSSILLFSPSFFSTFFARSSSSSSSTATICRCTRTSDDSAAAPSAIVPTADGACKIIDCRHKLKVHAAVPTKSQPNATHRSSEIEIAQCVWGGIHDHTSRR